MSLRFGLEILLTRYLSLAVAVTYQMSALLAKKEDLERVYMTEVAYDNGGQQEYMRIGDSQPLPEYLHLLGAGLSLAYYF